VRHERFDGQIGELIALLASIDARLAQIEAAAQRPDNDGDVVA
jgi:hypothetical protein